MEIEIKGFIEFCRFLSKHPEKIVDNDNLTGLLDFCFNAVMNCDCATGTGEKTKVYEQQFEDKIKSLPDKEISDLALILDDQNNFSDIFISFPLSGEKIKVK